MPDFRNGPARYRKIKKLEERAESMRAAAMNTTAPPDAERVQTSGGNFAEESIIAAMDIQTEIDAEMDKLQEERAAALEFIETLTDSIDRAVIRLRFRAFKTIPEIADEIGYSNKTIERILKRLIK